MKLNCNNLPSITHVWLVHDENTRTSEGFDDFYATREEAIAAAERDWGSLTERERKNRVIDVAEVITNDEGELDSYDRTPVAVFRA